jgi:DNA-binding HxlR family transcriptional regulator
MENQEKKYYNLIVQDVIDVLGGRWRGLILASLCDRDKRFNELRRDLGRITPRVLIKELKYLESIKLLKSKTDKENPQVNIYYLTDHGNSLTPLIEQIVGWGLKHRKIVLKE